MNILLDGCAVQQDRPTKRGCGTRHLPGKMGQVGASQEGCWSDVISWLNSMQDSQGSELEPDVDILVMWTGVVER
jgi:hypothetical protein